MAYGNMALEGFYIKCGVPESDAKITASVLGENFIKMQAMQRNLGSGKLAKGHAAVNLSDPVFNEAGSDKDYYLWTNASSIGDVAQAINLIKSVGVCSVCVYAYALGIDVSDKFVSGYVNALNIAKTKYLEFGGKLDVHSELDKFRSDINRLSIASSALGERKGLFSNIFG